MSQKLSKRAVLKALKTVIDPELGVSIVDLGLVYNVRLRSMSGFKKKVVVEMTLTSPGCPLAGVIESMVKEAVMGLVGVLSVSVELVWDPPWGSHMMTDEIKAELGIE